LFNTKNRLKFKLENLSETGIWLKKKNYAIRVAYEPNPNYELESLLLSYGENLQVLEPLSFVEKMRIRVEKMKNNY
jgi:predicted DNA-binding transcriptional regulator YafY